VALGSLPEVRRYGSMVEAALGSIHAAERAERRENELLLGLASTAHELRRPMQVIIGYDSDDLLWSQQEFRDRVSKECPLRHHFIELFAVRQNITAIWNSCTSNGACSADNVGTAQTFSAPANSTSFRCTNCPAAILDEETGKTMYFLGFEIFATSDGGRSNSSWAPAP